MGPAQTGPADNHKGHGHLTTWTREGGHRLSALETASFLLLEGRLEAGRPGPFQITGQHQGGAPLRALRDAARTPRVDKAQGSADPCARWHLEGVRTIDTTHLH